MPVVCLHGYAADHRLSEGWLEPVFTGLEGYRRLYPDLPGMGASVPDPALNDADSMVETLTDWVEAVIGDQRFLLAGESYGGYLALGMLRARLGSRVDGLMLLCPVMMAGRAERTLPPHTRLTADKDLLSRMESGKAFENFFGRSGFGNVQELGALSAGGAPRSASRRHCVYGPLPSQGLCLALRRPAEAPCGLTNPPVWRWASRTRPWGTRTRSLFYVIFRA